MAWRAGHGLLLEQEEEKLTCIIEFNYRELMFNDSGSHEVKQAVMLSTYC